MVSAIGGIMQSIYLKFYLTEKQKFGRHLLYEWMLEQAKHIGISGGSVFRSIAGYGRHGNMHSETFIELGGELPVQVEFVLDQKQANELIAKLSECKLNIRYVIYPVTDGVA
jgi:PII-like signaling protein